MHTLKPVPDFIGMLTDSEYNRLATMSTVRLPSPPRRCDTCRGTKTFKSWDSEGKELVEYRCDCKSQYRAALEMISRGIDGDYQRLDWYDLTDIDTEAMVGVEEYLTYHEAYISQGIGLSIHGNPGTGKSLLAYLVSKRLIEKGYDLYFAQHNHMLDTYKAGWKTKEIEDFFRERYYRSKILIIDDFGTEQYAQGRGTNETLLDQVLRTRAANNLPTILTTNLPAESLDPQAANSRYDVRIRSLLSGKNVTIKVRGKDFRPKRVRKQMEEARQGIRRPVVF